jgi:hypothetical protein
MKSRKHLKTMLFAAILLAVGATIGAALLIERQGGSQSIGKQDSGGAVGRPTHGPVVTSGIYGQALEAREEEAAPSSIRWRPPAPVFWPEGATGGVGAYGWVSEHEPPLHYGQQMRDGYGGAAYTFVGSGADNTAASRLAFKRGAESAPAPGSLFTAVPASLSPAANSGDVRAVTSPITPPVPEPAEWTMLVVGLLLIGMVARRRNRPQPTR